MDQDRQSVDYLGNNYIVHPSKTNSQSSLTQPPQSKPIKVIHPESFTHFETLKITDLWNKPFLGGYIDKNTLKINLINSKEDAMKRMLRFCLNTIDLT